MAPRNKLAVLLLLFVILVETISVASAILCDPNFTTSQNETHCICDTYHTGPTCKYVFGVDSPYCTDGYYYLGSCTWNLDGVKYNICASGQPTGRGSGNVYLDYNRQLAPIECTCGIYSPGAYRYGAFCGQISNSWCKNSGLNTHNINGACNCTTPSWTGYLCDLPTYCDTQGTASFNGTSCVCIQGYSGTYCNNTICGPLNNLCSGHGTCTVSGCECTTPYNGTLCNMDKCGYLSNPCSGRGECTPDGCDCGAHVAGGICEACDDTWTGSDCGTRTCSSIGTQQASIPYAQAPILNIHPPLCGCKVGWSGQWCDIYQCGTSASDACHSNGQCEQLHFLDYPYYWNDTVASPHPCSELELAAGIGFAVYWDNDGFQHWLNVCPRVWECACNNGSIGLYCNTSVTCDTEGTDFIVHECHCKVGWNGTSCDNYICGNKTHPCSGGGTCQNDGCLCDKEHLGVFCQYNYECYPNGTQEIDNKCICNQYYHGKHCDQPYVCNTNGTDAINYGCICNQYYYGEQCNQSYICNANGTLVIDRGCNCTQYYYGEQCQYPYTCNTKGTEEINHGCICNENYYGFDCSASYCSASIDSSILCNNHGQCQNRTCNCTDHWSGHLCTIQPCATVENEEPCSGIGTCINGQCICPYSTGAHCEFGVGCQMDGGTLSYNWTTSTCICKTGFMLPYCCPYNDDPSAGACNFGGERSCPIGLTWNPISGCNSIVIGLTQRALYLIPQDSMQRTTVGRCDYGFDPEEFCCPFGMVQVTEFDGSHGCVPYIQRSVLQTACSTLDLSQGIGHGELHTCYKGACTDLRYPAMSSVTYWCNCDPGTSGAFCNNIICNQQGTEIMLYDTFPFRTNEVCTCKSGWSNYMCSCPPPFKPWGTDDVSDITAAICAGYSECSVYVSENACACPSGYGGTFCCKESCSNHGICSLDNNTLIPYCECDTGWSGDYCQNVTSIATSCPNDCSGGGQCLYVDYKYDLDMKLGYSGDYQMLWNNISVAFFDGFSEVPYPQYVSVTSAADLIYWFIRSGRFQMERYKMETYGYTYTYNYVLDIIRVLFRDLYIVSKLDHDYIITLIPYIMNRSYDMQQAAVAFILSYGANINPASNQYKQMYPVDYRPFLHCVCQPSRSGIDCSSSCPTSPLNSRPCSMLNYGDFHGFCPTSSSQCACLSRYIGATCSEYIGEGCYPTTASITTCNNRGTCTQNYNMPGNYSCVCRDGVIGQYCDTYKCSASDPDPVVRQTECSQMGTCTAAGVCTCKTLTNDPVEIKPILPIGNNCQYNAIDQCGVATLLATNIYRWKECNGHGKCMNDTTAPYPYCKCDSGYMGNKCEQSLCTPECNSHQTCNPTTGACGCRPKWSTASTCTVGNRTCECQVSLCGSGTPDDTGSSCICDAYHRVDTSGVCTIVQCPLVQLTDTGEVPCSTSCQVSSATLSHSTQCCYDACKTAQGGTLCSLNSTGLPVCDCVPTAAFNQENGICYSKCHGHASLYDPVRGYQCYCLTSYFIQDPWNTQTDFWGVDCLRKRCLNGGTVSSATSSVCSCPLGFYGTLCESQIQLSLTSSSSSSSSSTASFSSSSLSSSFSSSVSSTHSSSMSSTSGSSSSLSISSGISSSTHLSSSTSSSGSSISSTGQESTNSSTSLTTQPDHNSSTSMFPTLNSSSSSSTGLIVINGTDSSSISFSTGEIIGIAMGGVVTGVALIGGLNYLIRRCTLRRYSSL